MINNKHNKINNNKYIKINNNNIIYYLEIWRIGKMYQIAKKKFNKKEYKRTIHNLLFPKRILQDFSNKMKNVNIHNNFKKTTIKNQMLMIVRFYKTIIKIKKK